MKAPLPIPLGLALAFCAGLYLDNRSHPLATPAAVLAPVFAISDRQRHTDDLLERGIAGFPANSDGRALAESVKAEYDALCRMDARLGTDEADRYLDEELPREERILHAMERSRRP